MSMNLIFTDKTGKFYTDFPVQTPTELTYAVMRAKPEDRLQIIKDYYSEKGFSAEETADFMEEIEDMFEDKDYVLTYL